jgi:hypothetical protein
VTGDRDLEAVYVVSETEALARMLRSEIGTGSWQQRVHVAWATRNPPPARPEYRSDRLLAVRPPGARPPGRQPPGSPPTPIASWLPWSWPPIRPSIPPAAPTTSSTRRSRTSSRRGVAGYRNRAYTRVRQIWIDRYGWEPDNRLGPDLELWGPRRR